MKLSTIGILVCDEISAPLGAQHGQYGDMFKRLLAASGEHFDLHFYCVYAGEFPDHVDSCDAYIISGSRRSVYEPLPWIARLETFLRALHAARRRTVGICFGHQLIGQAFGGRTEKAAQGWGLGRHTAEVLETMPWMQPPAPRYSLFAVHQDQVTTLPPGAQRLATSSHCANAMFVLDDVMLGVQAHPEFTADYARAITENKQGVAPAAVIEQALPGFAQQVDAGLLARWIVAFLGGDVDAPEQ